MMLTMGRHLAAMVTLIVLSIALSPCEMTA